MVQGVFLQGVWSFAFDGHRGTPVKTCAVSLQKMASTLFVGRKEREDRLRGFADCWENIDVLGREVSPIPGSFVPTRAPVAFEHFLPAEIIIQSNEVSLLEAQVALGFASESVQRSDRHQLFHHRRFELSIG